MTAHINFDLEDEEKDRLDQMRKRIINLADTNEFRTPSGKKTSRNMATWRYAISYWADRSTKYETLLRKYTELLEENERLKRAKAEEDKPRKRLVVV